MRVDWYDSAQPDWTDDDPLTGEAPPISTVHPGTEDASPDTADTRLEVRYRPTGRIHSFDTNVSDDDGLIVIHHNQLVTDRIAILLESHGPICILPRNTLPGGTANQRSCP